MDGREPSLRQCEVTVVVGQVGIDSRDHGRQPLPVLKRSELIVPATPELYRNLDGRELETPRSHMCHAVIPPALVTRSKSELAGVVAATGLFFGNPQQFIAEIVGLVFVLVWDGVLTFAILKLISVLVPLRMTEKQLEIGDESVHGDAAYELMPVPPAVTYQAPPIGSTAPTSA